MSEKKFLPKYSGETTDALLALASTHSADSVVLAFEEALAKKRASRAAHALTFEEETVLATVGFEREVTNGGFEPYFRNSSRDFSPVLVSALEALPGTKAAAEIARAALDALQLRTDFSVEQLDAAMDDLTDEQQEALESCSERYQTEAGELSDPLLAFIQSHRSRIRLP